jgi:hypothetical protein
MRENTGGFLRQKEKKFLKQKVEQGATLLN